MDPKETLAKMRESAFELLELNEVARPTMEDVREFTRRAVDLAEAVQAMDYWLTKGGFLPPDWNNR